MAANRHQTGSKSLLCSFLFIFLIFPVNSFGSSGDPTVTLDQGIDLFEDNRFRNAENTLLKLVKSSAFRRLDTSQRSLAYAYIAYSKINRGKELDSISYIEKAMAETKREFGKRSLAYLDHMQTKAVALYWADKRRQAVRMGESMLDILERMKGDYRKEQRSVRNMMADMRKLELEEGKIPDDMSDFYSTCESIEQQSFVSKAHAIMSHYKLVGTDVRPDYKKAQYFKTTYLRYARESSKDRKNRLIYIPDKQHMDDWCVIYPDGNRVERVVISAKNDR